MKIVKQFENNLGVLSFKYQGIKSKGTAFVLKEKNKVVISTAAHCVYDWQSKKFYKDIFFISSLKKKYRVDEVYLHKYWTDDAIVDYDTAFLVAYSIDENEFEYISPKFNLEFNQFYYILHHSNFIFFNNKKVFRGYSSKDNFKNSTLKGMNLKLKNGDSGCPWLVKYNNDFYQNSNSSMSFIHNEDIIWGIHWGNDIKVLYESCLQGSPKNENVIRMLM